MGIETYATPTSGGATATGATARRGVPAPPRPRAVTKDPGGQQAKTWTLIGTGERRSVPQTPAPRLRQLMGVCVWAAVLGGVGLLIVIRALIGAITAEPASWYQPSILSVGLTGVALTVAAFVTVQRRWIPYALLGGASLFLIAALVLTANAF